MKVISLSVVLTMVVGCQCATNCHWGPSYWCQDEVTAEECGQTQYCKDDVWKDDLPQEGMCDFCESVIEIIQIYVNASTTKIEAEAIADIVCTLLPNGLELVCNTTMNTIIRASLIFLKKEVDPEICEQVCNSTYLEDDDEIRDEILLLPNWHSDSKVTVLAKSQPHPQLPAADDTCSFVIKTIKNYGAMEEQAEVLEKLCSVLPNGLQSMVQSADVEVILRCAVCDVVMKELDSVLNDNPTEEAIVNLLDKVCDQLPSITLKIPCEAFVNQNTPAIIGNILSGITGKKLCSTLGVCSGSPICFMCKVSVNNAKNLIIRGTSIVMNTVATVAGTMCRFVPPILKNRCRGMIKRITSMSIQLVDHVLNLFVNPEVICQIFKVCHKIAGATVGAIPLV